MCSDYHEGGIKMINVKGTQLSMLCEWAVKLRSDTVSRWSILAKETYKLYGPELVCFESSVGVKSYKGLRLIKSVFWRDVLSAWLDSSQNKNGSFLSTVIWNNDKITYRSSPLFFTDWLRNGVFRVTDICNGNTLMTFDEVCRLVGQGPQRILEYNVVANAVGNFIRSFPHFRDVIT